MPYQYELITINLAGKPRHKKFQGRDYLVVDAVLLAEGVLNGSRGPLYYPPDEIAANPGIWNNVPIVAWHPKDANGNPTLARSPDILEEYGLGILFNDRYSHTSKKRLAEAWWDVERTKQFDKRLDTVHKMMPRIEAGLPIELSTGLFTENHLAPSKSVFNTSDGISKPYALIARNYRPDHLAALPDQIGACSIKDGCGFNVNNNPNNEIPQEQIEVEVGVEVESEVTENINPKGCNQYTGPDCKLLPTGVWPEHISELRGAARSASIRAVSHSVDANLIKHDEKSQTASEKAGKLATRAIASQGKTVGKNKRASTISDEAADAHHKASILHREAADKHKVNQEAHIAHQRAADSHSIAGQRFQQAAHGLRLVGNTDTEITSNNNQSEVSDMKNDDIKWLVTNCDCWKNHEPALNGMSEAEVASWKKYHEKAKKDAQVANAISEGATMNFGSKVIPVDLTTNSNGKIECEPKNKEDLNMTGNQMNFDDEKVRDAVCNKLFGMTANESQAVLNSAKKIEQRERFNLVNKLVANVKDETVRKSKVTELLKLPTGQLELLTSFLPEAPVHNSEVVNETDLFLKQFYGGSLEGSQGGPIPNTNNRQPIEDKPDVDGGARTMPTLNYDEASDLGKKVRQRNGAA